MIGNSKTGYRIEAIEKEMVWTKDNESESLDYIDKNE